MSKILEQFISNVLNGTDENKHETFVELSAQIYFQANQNPEIWLSKILSNLFEYPESYVSELIEEIIDRISPLSLQNSLATIYRDSNEIAKKLIIESLELREDVNALNFLVSIKSENVAEEISRISAITELEQALKTGELKEFLLESYSYPNLPPSTKQSIRECLADVYKYTQEIDKAHEDYCLKNREAHVKNALKSAQDEFRKNRYKTVVKLLSHFEDSELPEMGIRILKVSKRKIADTD